LTIRGSVAQLSLALAFMMTARAHAYQISEATLFARCFAQITGQPVPLGHGVHQQVKKGAVSGINACNQLIDKTMLGADGRLPNNGTDPEAVAVLNQFYNFHRTWFPVNNIEQMADYDASFAGNTEDVFDFSEPALAVTRALFSAHKYSEILTSFGVPRAARRPDPNVMKAHGLTGAANEGPSRRIFGASDYAATNSFAFRAEAPAPWGDRGTGSFVVNGPTRIQTGDLIGIPFNSEQFMTPNYTLQPLFPDQNTEMRGKSEPGLIYNLDMLAGNGGGILGYPSYLLAYFGHGRGFKANGTTKLPRRWAQQTVSTFLCSSLPVLRDGDVSNHLRTNSPTPFRASTSCLTCHGTMDQMAYVARNFAPAYSDYSLGNDPIKVTALMGKFQPSRPAASEWSDTPVEGFHLTPPTGRFLYRSVTGALINQPVNGLNQLGEALTATEDFYQCAAKRYFEHFTGIRVAFFDMHDPRNAEVTKRLTARELRDRKYVEALGAQLKKNQSLAQLIKTIIASPYNRASDFRP
jgi:hypothetical protein